MELKYLWDTNIVIYYLQNQFPLQGEEFIDNIALKFQPSISVITEIELLSWKLSTDNDTILIDNFIANSIVYQLDHNIKTKTIEIRKNFKLKLPDAIIAASALVNNHMLISRNVSDFAKITELKVLDPFNIDL